MPLFEIGMVLAGLFALYAGAEGLVRGASASALQLGVTPLVVGLTVVSFGTSAPELLVSLLGTDDIAVGNILGSNVANLLLILGAASMVRPLEVRQRAIRLEFPVMAAATVLFMVLILNGALSRLNGIILLVAMGGFLSYQFLLARREAIDAEEVLEEDLDDEAVQNRHWLWNLLMIFAGIVGLAIGAKWMVDGSIVIADYIGVSELVIAISIVALGTSLPEVATSVVAAWRDEVGMAVGNAIGSNIFNLLFVLGIVATIGSVRVSDQVLQIDMWVVLAVSVAVWPLLRTGHKIDRKEGALMLAVYAGYVISLFLR